MPKVPPSLRARAHGCEVVQDAVACMYIYIYLNMYVCIYTYAKGAPQFARAHGTFSSSGSC